MEVVDRSSNDWQAIMHGMNNQVVLYNPTNKALTIAGAPRDAEAPPQLEWDEEYDTVDDTTHNDLCPYCHRPMNFGQDDTSPVYPRVPNYFHLLAESTTTSRAQTPPSQDSNDRPFGTDAMAEGYFDTFFREERKLGMGANGSVFLCQHVLDGNLLGHFAVKKIAVGSSHEYLVQILREVRLLETLRHQNIITYHHAWLESCRFSSFGPSVPTLHVLMQWAEGGSLDDFIASRQGMTASGDPISNGANGAGGPNNDANMTKAERIAAFRARSQGGPRARAATMKAIHLLSAEEILSLFGDITAGLAFLHNRTLLHLDLKPGNVLLTWDSGALIPRAMLSDFGASKDMLHQSAHARTGVTGTLEYTAPEILAPDPHTGVFREMDTKSDIWSLGIILYKLVFFHTPYVDTNDFAAMQEEILGYAGFFPPQEVLDACSRRGLPAGLLKLLQTLLDLAPLQRPSSDRVLAYIRTEALNFVPPSNRPRSPNHQHRQRRSKTGNSSSSTSTTTPTATASPDNSLVRAPPPSGGNTPPGGRHSSQGGQYFPQPQISQIEEPVSSPMNLSRTASSSSNSGATVRYGLDHNRPTTSRDSVLDDDGYMLVEDMDEDADSVLPPRRMRRASESSVGSGARLPTQTWLLAEKPGTRTSTTVSAANQESEARWRSVLLTVKIITLTLVASRYPTSQSPIRAILWSTIVCTAASLAVLDVYSFGVSPPTSSTYPPTLSTTTTQIMTSANVTTPLTPRSSMTNRNLKPRNIRSSVILAIVHVLLLPLLRICSL